MEERLNAVIVEDNPAARKLLLNGLAKRCPQINVVATAETVDEAYTALTTHQADLVFLDIDLGKEKGFDLLRRLYDEERIDFDLIFITAHGNYENARKAIEFCAMDFVEKPYDERRLAEAVEKVLRTSPRQARRQMELFLAHLAVPQTTRFAFRTVSGGLEFVDLEDVLYLKADTQVAYVHLASGRHFAVSHHLGYYIRLLQDGPERFFCISQSLLINLRYLQHYHHGKLTAVLKNGAQLPASRRYGKEFRQLIVRNGGQLPVPLSRQNLIERVWQVLRQK